MFVIKYDFQFYKLLHNFFFLFMCRFDGLLQSDLVLRMNDKNLNFIGHIHSVLSAK